MKYRIPTRQTYQGADKSLAWPGRKQAQKYIRDVCDFDNIETGAVIKNFFLQGKAPKEIQAILTETLACFLPGRAKDSSATLQGNLIQRNLWAHYRHFTNVSKCTNIQAIQYIQVLMANILYNYGNMMMANTL